MKRVYSTTLLEEAEFLRMALRDSEIDSFLENQGGAMYAVGMPTSAAPLYISVADDKADEAARVIEGVLAARRSSKPAPESDEPGAQKFRALVGRSRRRNRLIWLILILLPIALLPFSVRFAGWRATGYFVLPLMFIWACAFFIVAGGRKP